MTSLAHLPTAVVVVTGGRRPRMLHLEGCLHNSMPATVTRRATATERAALRDCSTCLARAERGAR